MNTINVTLNPRNRLELSTTIENLINMLDDLDGDPDLEPYLACLQQGSVSAMDREGDEGCWDGDADLEASLGWANLGSQSRLEASADGREEENEHGGDIQEEPHDMLDQGDDEPFLGWRETCAQGHTGLQMNLAPSDPDDVYAVPLHFNGEGGVAGRGVLRNLRRARPNVRQNYVGRWCEGSLVPALKVRGLTITGTRAAKPDGSEEALS